MTLYDITSRLKRARTSKRKTFVGTWLTSWSLLCKTGNHESDLPQIFVSCFPHQFAYLFTEYKVYRSWAGWPLCSSRMKDDTETRRNGVDLGLCRANSQTFVVRKADETLSRQAESTRKKVYSLRVSTTLNPSVSVSKCQNQVFVVEVGNIKLCWIAWLWTHSSKYRSAWKK